MRIYIGLLIVFILAGCAPGDSPEPAALPQDALDRAVEAHGGLDVFRSFGGLSYDMDRGNGAEPQVIDLWQRRIRWEGDGFTLMFDGDSVHVAPDTSAFPGNPMFSSSLYFYFFGIPFLLADPGTVREPLGRMTVDGEPFDAVKVGYEAGVGESPQDNYIALMDTTSHQLRLVLYTVTFNSSAPSDNYSALEYRDWQQVDGLLVPREFVGRRWHADGDSLGTERYRVRFDNVSFSAAPPPDSLFTTQ